MFDPNEVHVMIDIETLDLTPDAAIVSIGAVKFCPTATPGKWAHETVPSFPAGISSTFYQVVNLTDSLKQGFSVGGSTLTWWLHQEPVAQSVLKEGGTDIQTVLEWFNSWLDINSVTNIWAGPSTFDIPILEHAYRRMGWKSAPWSWNQVRCYRTVRMLLNNLIPETVDIRAPSKIPHHALYDAMAQATTLQHLVFALRHEHFLAGLNNSAC